MIKISPSVLAADLSRLDSEVKEIQEAGADMVHLDVMDGRFVTNISFGLPVISCLRKRSSMIFDVHLMIEEPERYIDRFIEAGADILTFHYEASKDPAAALDAIRAKGVKSAISIKPATPAEVLYPLLEKCDMVLVMSVELGFGGQSFMPSALDKLSALRDEIKRQGLDTLLEVDGGINTETAKLCVEAGANVLVAGNFVFTAPDIKAAMASLKNL